MDKLLANQIHRMQQMGLDKTQQYYDLIAQGRQQGKSNMVDDLIKHGVHIKKVTMDNIGEIKSEEIPYADFYSIDESNEL